MIIRPVKDVDYSYLYDFTKNAFTTAYVSTGDEQNYASNVRASSNYIKDLEYVAEEDGKVVGDVLISTFPFEYNKKSISLDLVCVDIAFRNKGLGQSLIEVALKKAQNLGYEVVFVAGDPKFYSKLGFKPTIEYSLKNTNDLEDRYIMCKELKAGALKGVEGLFSFTV